MTDTFLEGLIDTLANEHPETVIQALMYAIGKVIHSFRLKGNSILEILNEMIESLNDEMKARCSIGNITRKSSESVNLVYNWNKAQEVGKLLAAHSPTARLKEAANFYAKIVVDWSFACPKNILNLQTRIHFSGEESDFEIANRIVDYFIMWLSAPEWQD